MYPLITTVSTNKKQILPEVGAGGTVSQESDKINITIPLNHLKWVLLLWY